VKKEGGFMFKVFILLLISGIIILNIESADAAVRQEIGKCETITYSTNPQYPPYDWGIGTDRFDGASIELLGMVTPPGVKLKPVLFPWKRSMALAAEGEIDLLVSLRITPERSEYLKFTSHRAFPNPIVIFVRKDHTFPYKEWKDLKGKRGGISLGDTFGAGFDEYWRKELTMEDAPSMVENFKKLDEGRIDFFVTSRYLGEAYVSSQRFQNKIAPLAIPISTMDIHFGFSKKSACVQHLEYVSRRLKGLDKNGVPEKLLKKHLERFKNQPGETFK
jgi:polar amino acid transport system substrate-binding protein